MAVAKILKDYLNKSKVKYKAMKHSEVYTAQEVAHAQHVPGRFLAKSVIVKMDAKFIMVVLPAHFMVDMARFKKLTGAKKVRLATEKEFEGLFPGCEIGAMPPFGNLYNIPVGVDKSLTQDELIVFNAGTHKDTIKMKYKDFEKLVQPKIGPFAQIRPAGAK